ncbi:MAG: hypothetical protein CSB55_03720 [Candidatus Cloacimonadota bacterium]|nr:MAG: hypothetical protein CSB55_03720 [Candidatus Cloacimonadota bacterium]
MRKLKIFGRNVIELTGAIHIHTSHSFDSETPIEKIIKTARKYRIDYLMITDHNNLECRNEKSVKESDYPKVIVGTEVNDKQLNNHLLVFESDKIYTNCDAREYTQKYHEEKAISFVAHPSEKRACGKYRKYEWTLNDFSQVDGLEIWNFLSSWLGKLRPSLNGIFMVLFPFLFTGKPEKENLEIWDRVNVNGQRKAGIGSIDAHGTPVSFGKFTFHILKHKLLLRSLRTNILLEENTEISNRSILRALKNGNSYIVNYRRGMPYNFYAGISGLNGKEAIFGEEINFAPGLKFYFRLPGICRIDLYRNGKKSDFVKDEKGFFEIKEKGSYRLEILRYGRGWIYTNNIYVI